MVKLSLLALALQTSAQGLPGRYECGIEHQALIYENGYDPARQSVDFATDQRSWRFQLRLTQGDDSEATVEWPSDPIQLAGTYPMLSVEAGQTAFMALRQGPCTFTDQACLALVQLSARPDGNLAFSILPTGSLRRENGNLEIFHVVFTGTCRRQSGAQR